MICQSESLSSYCLDGVHHSLRKHQNSQSTCAISKELETVNRFADELGIVKCYCMCVCVCVCVYQRGVRRWTKRKMKNNEMFVRTPSFIHWWASWSRVSQCWIRPYSQVSHHVRGRLRQKAHRDQPSSRLTLWSWGQNSPLRNIHTHTLVSRNIIPARLMLSLSFTCHQESADYSRRAWRTFNGVLECLVQPG